MTVGERGPKGDHGQAGDVGETGPRGVPGPIGLSIGERGPQGDHGQHGDTGETGDTGQTGQTGATGAKGSLSWVQALTMFIFIVLAFGLVSTRTELNQNKINQILHNQSVIRYTDCLQGVLIVQHFNAAQDALIQVEIDTIFSTAVGKDLSARRVAALRESEIKPEPTRASCQKP